MIPDILIDEDVTRWLKEDIPFWDISVQVIPNKAETAKIISKSDGIICGVSVIKRIFKLLNVNCEALYQDGDKISEGDTIVNLQGNSIDILQAERTALNILSHLSGIATSTKKYIEILGNPKIKIAGTRKTLPGLRKYEKWAIQCGGGDTHRTSLSDMIMLKENHIAASGGIREAVTAIKEKISFSTKIEVEVRNLDEVKEAVNANVDIIMLDNFNLDKLKEAIKFIRSNTQRTLIEISGNVTENTLKTYSNYDIDIISSGKLTHSVEAFDISLIFNSVKN